MFNNTAVKSSSSTLYIFLELWNLINPLKAGLAAVRDYTFKLILNITITGFMQLLESTSTKFSFYNKLFFHMYLKTNNLMLKVHIKPTPF
jgi:hypothetical protein